MTRNEKACQKSVCLGSPANGIPIIDGLVSSPIAYKCIAPMETAMGIVVSIVPLFLQFQE